MNRAVSVLMVVSMSLVSSAFDFLQLVARVIEKERSKETVTSLSKSFHAKQVELKKLLQKGICCLLAEYMDF